MVTTAETYLEFVRYARGVSPCFEQWALGVADDPEVLALIDTLPVPKRQPNLIFAAARLAGAEAGPYQNLREVLLSQWDEIAETAATRRTQTNETGRCATLLPLLAALPEPLALVEVGASAGLCLFPDRYSYQYDGRTRLDPVAGPSEVLLRCETSGEPPLPDRLPEVVWRAGLDLNPLDVWNADDVGWLEMLVWPEHEHRRTRLRAAVEVARRDAPRILRADLNDGLVALASEAPPDATLVVFHSAVLTYLSVPDRDRFVRTTRGLPGHWISNEGPEVLPGVTATAAPQRRSAEGMVLALDGRARGWAGPHGDFLDWL